MNILLRLKHWQLFLLLIGIPMILEFVFIGIIITSQKPTSLIFIFPFIMIFVMGVFFDWFYELGTNLHKKLPDTVKMSLMRFKIFLLIPIVYILCICIFIFGILFNNIFPTRELPNIGCSFSFFRYIYSPCFVFFIACILSQKH